jgi:sugar phosphate isomerase/epimerase
MSDALHLPRRRFLRWTGLAASALLAPRLFPAAEATAEPGSAQVALGICGRMTGGRLYHEAGCAYLEEAVTSFLIPEQDDAKFAKRLEDMRASPLPVTNCNSFIPGKLKAVGADTRHPEILAYADIAFRRAKQAGIGIITFGSGPSRQVPDGWNQTEAKEQFIVLLRRLGPLAEAQGVRVAVEPLNRGECNLLNNIREVGEVVRAAKHPSIGITADLYHMALGGDVASDLADHIDLLHHFHVAEKAKRALPGVAGDDFRGWFRVLARQGWQGRMSIEANGSGELTALTKSIHYLQNQAKEAGI